MIYERSFVSRIIRLKARRHDENAVEQSTIKASLFGVGFVGRLGFHVLINNTVGPLIRVDLLRLFQFRRHSASDSIKMCRFGESAPSKMGVYIVSRFEFQLDLLKL